jgi:hypothetical protein
MDRMASVGREISCGAVAAGGLSGTKEPPKWGLLAASDPHFAPFGRLRKRLLLLAEAVRFELTDGRPSLVFKTSALNRSATLPNSSKPFKNFSRFSFRLRQVG